MSCSLIKDFQNCHLSYLSPSMPFAEGLERLHQPRMHSPFSLLNSSFPHRHGSLHPLTCTRIPGILSIFSNPMPIVITFSFSWKQMSHSCFKSIHLDIAFSSLQLILENSVAACLVVTGFSWLLGVTCFWRLLFLCYPSVWCSSGSFSLLFLMINFILSSLPLMATRWLFLLVQTGDPSFHGLWSLTCS